MNTSVKVRSAVLGDVEDIFRLLEIYAPGGTVLRRSKEDIGSGLFFRKEYFYNGDSKWRLLLNIAGGEKNGSKENTHVLYLIYRNRRDGNKQEKLIFPFISIQKEGENSRVSFLGRIYQKSVVNGKSSGYIFFIPF